MQSQTLAEGDNSDRTKYKTKTSPETTLPPDLAVVVNAWPGLPEVVRVRIVGMVEGATAAGAER